MVGFIKIKNMFYYKENIIFAIFIVWWFVIIGIMLHAFLNYREYNDKSAKLIGRYILVTILAIILEIIVYMI